ncbi:hypothetical protein C3R44_23615, partial [Mycobacterium tuberculosis]
GTSGAQDGARGRATGRTEPEAPKHAGSTTGSSDRGAPGGEGRPRRQSTGDADDSGTGPDSPSPASHSGSKGGGTGGGTAPEATRR